MSTAAPARRLYVVEPRSAWLLREPVVADCSVLAAVLFEEPNADEAAGMLMQHALHAPSLLAYELASVAGKKLRGGGQPEQVQAALADFADQRIELHAVSAAGVCDLAARYDLSAYDAAYLWLAAELGAPLATFDNRLAQAAKRHLGAGQ